MQFIAKDSGESGAGGGGGGGGGWVRVGAYAYLTNDCDTSCLFIDWHQKNNNQR